MHQYISIPDTMTCLQLATHTNDMVHNRQKEAETDGEPCWVDLETSKRRWGGAKDSPARWYTWPREGSARAAPRPLSPPARRRLSLDLNLREDRNSATTLTRWRRIDSFSPLARRRLSRDLHEDRNSATTGTRRGASRRRHKPFRVHGIAEPTGGAIVIGWEQLEFLFYEGEQLDMDAAPNRVEVGHLFLG